MALTPSASYSLTARVAIKVAAAQAIASVVSRKELHEEYVIPSVFNKKLAPAVAREIVRAAQRGGFARRRPAH